MQTLDAELQNWKHPRPARDPRLVCFHLGMIWAAFVQVVAGPPPATVQAQAFSYEATAAFSALMVVCSILVIVAAYCKSQYASFGIELAGCTGFTFVFGLYTLALVSSIADWYASTGAGWALAFFAGNALRAGTLAWRLW